MRVLSRYRTGEAWWDDEDMGAKEQTRFAVSRPCPECPWRTDVDTGRFPPGVDEPLRIGSAQQGV